MTGNSSSGGSAQIEAGMQVVGSDMDNIGRIKEVDNGNFLIEIPLRRNIYVPLSAIRSVTGNQVMLNITADRIYSMNWALSN